MDSLWTDDFLGVLRFENMRSNILNKLCKMKCMWRKLKCSPLLVTCEAHGTTPDKPLPYAFSMIKIGLTTNLVKGKLCRPALTSMTL